MTLRLTRTALILVVITALAFGLRVTHLDTQGLWSDEFTSLGRAMLAPSELLRDLPVEHVPLYFWLLHCWTLAAGSSDFALRFLSVIWGTLAVPLLYALGRRLVARPAAVMAAFLLAINPFQVWYSQDTRMYSMLVGLGLMALWALDVALTEDAPRTLLNDLTVKLRAWTGRNWLVSLSKEEGGQTLAEMESARRESAFLDARSDPTVAAILARFPGAKIIDVRIPEAADDTADEANDLPADPVADDED